MCFHIVRAAWFDFGCQIMRQSRRLLDFSRFLRPGGPRILRSILCRLRITGFLDSLGNDFRNMLAYSAFLLDSGYTRTRQSTELFLHFTHFLHEDGLGTTTSVENGGDYTVTPPAPFHAAYRCALWLLTVPQVAS